MKQSLKNVLQTFSGVILGAVFLYFTLRGKPLDEIVESLRHADLFWMLMSGAMLFVVFVLRALRWEVILHSSDAKANIIDVNIALFIGYFVNSFTPKLGELIRCTNLKRNHDIKLSTLLGTVVSERIYDVLVLALGLVFFALYELDRLGGFFEQAGQNVGASFLGKDFLIYLFLGFLAVMVMVYVFRKKLANYRLFGLFYHFVSDMYLTVVKTFRLKRFNLFFLYTILIWITLIALNYCYLKALPETDSYSVYFATVVLFVGGIGWALPAPGGIGTTHFFILQLFIAFSLSESAGVSFGILSNGLNFIYTIVFGLLALGVSFFRNRKRATAAIA
ncbi:MAG: flippase-like domain-containing protein [Bacteroidales bacterium]|nr:flippase-like domain-containing protein [Bacteroidales bacterium]MCF8454633.1 flippase-like domain-containing protein [Bacteroidales bacterium]